MFQNQIIKNEINTDSNIKNVLICGLGGLGCICATQISKCKDINLKILVDESRYDKYKKQTTFFNEQPFQFNYIKPDFNNFKADLIIIATKNDGLDFAVNNIKNFVDNNTIFISLLNGILSEEKIASIYGWNNILLSFYIGHSCIREERHIFQDGIYKFVIGNNSNVKNVKSLQALSYFFEKAHINYEISENIIDEYWKKFMINVGINQLSAVTGLTLKNIKKDKYLTETLIGLMKEVDRIAEVHGIKNHAHIFKAAKNFLLEEIQDATPSMLQDIKARRKTEVDILAGTVIKLAEKYKIETPLNKKVYKQIKKIEK